MAKSVLLMAGGTGGHIYPGLAVARALIDLGWTVTWLGGHTGSMEYRIIHSEQAKGLSLGYEMIEFGGLRGKKVTRLLAAPFMLCKALWQSYNVLGQVKPDVVIGMGGYISFPTGLCARLMGFPLVIHEQNSVAGLSNRLLARLTSNVLTAFPDALVGKHIGNPLRAGFLNQQPPALRFSGRAGPLSLLVIGGSLGAKALNDLVPKAISLIPIDQRPQVVHQSGASQLEALQASYLQNHVVATCTAFIDDTATAFAQADLIIARSGASTVTEIAAVGAAALFVPFPHAVDDHQTGNAKYLVAGREGQAGAWLEQQSDLNAAMLADFLQTITREELLAKALIARELAQVDATEHFVSVCQELVP